MPIYVYRCAICGSTFERITSFGDTTEATCPNGHTDTRRVFSPPGIIFKGHGFYVTDHRPNGKSGDGKDD